MLECTVTVGLPKITYTLIYGCYEQTIASRSNRFPESTIVFALCAGQTNGCTNATVYVNYMYVRSIDDTLSSTVALLVLDVYIAQSTHTYLL